MSVHDKEIAEMRRDIYDLRVRVGKLETTGKDSGPGAASIPTGEGSGVARVPFTIDGDPR